MTELFLKKDGGDWQQVYFSTSGSGFKLTRENPYFTESESYTLDVSLPMDIIDNRQFFGNLQRIDTTKKSTKYQCRLMVGNKSMLDGTARVSQVTQDTVKVQLLGGNSELNFLSKEEGAYIDEMELGDTENFVVWSDYKGNIDQMLLHKDIAIMPTYDETNGLLVNNKSCNPETGVWAMVVGDKNQRYTAPQPRLLYIIKAVLYKSGYNLVRCDIDRLPWSRLFVASAKQTKKLSHALPHWHVGEFLSEVCKFFNCTITVDSRSKDVSIVSNTTIFNDGGKTAITPVDEYTSEIEEDDSSEVLAASNIEFDMSSSSEHVYDVLADDVREAIPHKSYSSKLSAASDLTLSEQQRYGYIFVCPEGNFFWRKDLPILPSFFYPVDYFAHLIRDSKSDSTISLKICPVAMFYSNDALYYGRLHNNPPKMDCLVASLENPTGHERGLFSDIPEENELVPAQDLIEGSESVDKAEKEDRLQVFFIGSKEQLSTVQSGSDKDKNFPCPMPFTDWHGFPANLGFDFEPWSLSLRQSEATHYLGQLHNTGFSFNTKAKHTFRFIADTMPDPTDVFQIHGKLYGCEKIEANVTEEGFDRLMTGYFYEML